MYPNKSKKRSLLLIVITLASVNLSPFIINSAFALPVLILTTQTEKTSYYLGEVVKIFGTVTDSSENPVENAGIGIEIKDAAGNTIFIDGVWTQSNGYYQDTFRLPTAAPIGEYRLYVTANKPGYKSASKQASFFVTTPQIGHTIIKIVGHTIELSENNIITAKQNITMFSKSMTTTTISNRFILLSPSGTIKYDNFIGIGTSQDLHKIVITNGTTETVTFQFTLSTPTPGYYISMFCIFDEYGSNRLDATPWIPAFLYTPPPKYTQDIGTLAPNSQIAVPLSIALNRYESARFSLILTHSMKSLTIYVGAESSSKLLITLNQSTNIVKQELVKGYQWAIFNLPSGPYTLKVIALSNSASLSNIILQSANQIIEPTVTITNVEATTKIATPGGTVSYHLFVEWDILIHDYLNVSAYVQGTLSDSKEIEVATLSFREKDFYLSITIPSDGTFEILFTAELKQSGVSAQHTIPITTQQSEYNITVLSSVIYYKQPSFWEWIWGARTPKYYQDPSQLSVLDVQDIKIVDVGVDQQNNPKNATIEFLASNKAGNWLSFGDGPHYDVWLLDSLGYRFQVGVVFAGESRKKCYATLPIDAMRRLSFTIYFKISLWAEAISLTFSAVEVLISVYTASLSAVASQFVSDITKLTALYIYEAMVEGERGYITKTDIGPMLLGSGIPEDIVHLAEELFSKNHFNPAYAIISALVDGFSDKQIDTWTFANAIIRFILYMINRSKPDLASKVLIAFNKACQKYLVEVPSNLQKIGLQEIDKFLRNIGIIFSIARLVKIVVDLWTCPPEEGKIVNSEIGTEQPINPFDPIIEIKYEGPSNNTSIDYYNDVKSVHFSAMDNITEASFTVDPNMTANFLEIMSQPAFQKAMLRSIGFNATSTNLEWQNETSTFLLEANGSMFEGLHEMSFHLNNTWIQGMMEMSADAIPIDGEALLNVSLLYPFGKNLTHNIKITLPEGSSNITVLSPGNYTIQDNVITWDAPVDLITVKFTPTIHNVSIASLTPIKTIVGQGYPMLINVTVQNNGNSPEVFNVTVYANTTEIETKEITLSNCTSTTFPFIWNTTGFVKGNYTIWAYAWPVPNETDTADNTFIFGVVTVTIKGDVDGDFDVDIYDVVKITSIYGSARSDPEFNPNSDLDDDGEITIYDVVRCTSHYGDVDP